MNVGSETLKLVIDFSNQEFSADSFNCLIKDLMAVNGSEAEAPQISSSEFRQLEYCFNKYGAERMSGYCELYALEVVNGTYPFFNFSELINLCKEFEEGAGSHR